MIKITTENLKLHVITETDDSAVSEFFQKIAGSGVGSNFEILDVAIKNLQDAPPVHEHDEMIGATSTSSGKAGFVPAPTAADETAFLRGDGTWATPEGKNYTAGDGIDISSDNKINNTGVLSVIAGTEDGSINVDGKDIPVTGLGSAAFTDSSAYATNEHQHSYAGSSTTGGKAISAETADVATKATQDANGNTITSTYETKSDSIAKLEEAKKYTDEIKDDLLNGAGEAYDTLKELGDLIDENHNAIDALETVATGKADKVHSHDDLYYTENEIDTKISDVNTSIAGKQDKITGTQGQFVGFDADGNAVAQSKSEDYVRYEQKQELTDAQKVQARENIGAGTSDFDGKYESLTGKPIIHGIIDTPVIIQHDSYSVTLKGFEGEYFKIGKMVYVAANISFESDRTSFSIEFEMPDIPKPGIVCNSYPSIPALCHGFSTTDAVSNWNFTPYHENGRLSFSVSGSSSATVRFSMSYIAEE